MRSPRTPTVVSLSICAVALCALAAPAPARAQSAAELLKQVDATVGAGSDQTLRMEMVTSERGKADRSLTFQVTVKGHMRRIEFIAPGDVKGTRILVLSPAQMYIYLPAFRKVRRIATHMKEQGFMGSAWDHDEFSLGVFGEIFEAESVEDHDGYWTLALKRRDGQDFAYPKLQVDVRKDNKQPMEIRYINDKGVVAKTEQRLEFVCQKDKCSPRLVVMVDHTRNDITTRMHMKDWKVGQGAPESFFTVRALQRGV